MSANQPSIYELSVLRFNQRLFEDLAPAIWTLRFFQNVIRHARIGADESRLFHFPLSRLAFR